MASRVETAYQPNFSLIVAEDDGRMLTLGDGATLAVFSGEREAKMLLFLGVCKDGWKVRQTSPGELFSMLDGARVSVKRVALDPPRRWWPKTCWGSSAWAKTVSWSVLRIAAGA